VLVSIVEAEFRAIPDECTIPTRVESNTDGLSNEIEIGSFVLVSG
jgi:hypothetical protein